MTGRSTAIGLLDESVDRIEQPGWRPLAEVAVAAAKRRLAKRSDIEDLKPLELAVRLAGRPYSVASALAIVDDWPGNFDPLGHSRRPDPPARCVQQLTLAIEEDAA